MCGIAGIIAPDQSAETLNFEIRRMTDRIQHRGPDGEGHWVRDGVALGHRRLAIIDIDGGHQPFVSNSSRFILTYNGEIYNYRELRSDLQKHGCVFHTSSDTEVLMNAWEVWGPESVHKIEGMFCFAIWDKQESRLWLVRDRIGIKPCYYTTIDPGIFVFSSELKGNLACSFAREQKLRHDAIQDYLSLGYVPLDKTIFHDTRKLLPGEMISIGRDGKVASRKKYWSPSFAHPEKEATAPPSSEQIWTTVSDAVQKQTVADVPVAAFLSGGVDSSAVCAAMASAVSDPITAYSIGFESAQFDETSFAVKVAQSLGIDHKVRRVDIDDARDLRRISRIYDEPFADSSAIPTNILCGFAANSHKVALSGDGGDESFFGYPWYGSHLRLQRLRSFLGTPFTRSVAAPLYKVGLLAKAFIRQPPGLGTLLALSKDPSEGYFLSQSLSPFVDTSTLLHPDIQTKLQGYRSSDLFRSASYELDSEQAANLSRHLDFDFYLPGDILTKVDRASMANSLEVRVPLLDERVVELGSSLSLASLMPSGKLKGALVASAAPHLPESVLTRKKMGFSVPLDNWFKQELGDLLEATLLNKDSVLQSIVDRESILSLINAHRHGQGRLGGQLWSILQLEHSLSGLAKRTDP